MSATGSSSTCECFRQSITCFTDIKYLYLHSKVWMVYGRGRFVPDGDDGCPIDTGCIIADMLNHMGILEHVQMMDTPFTSRITSQNRISDTMARVAL